MNRWIHTALAALALAVGLPAQAATSYRFTSPVYTSVTNFTPPCGPFDGTCQTLAAGERVRGTFTTTAPLPANLSIATNSYGLVSGWSFSNGTITLTPASPGVRVLNFRLATNSAGEITDSLVEITRWTDGAASGHVTGERVEYLRASISPGTTMVNGTCTLITTSSAGMADTCLGHNPIASSSHAAYPAGGIWARDSAPPPPGARPVPALGAAGLGITTLLASALGARRLRRRRS